MQRMPDKDLLDLEYTKNRASERNVLLTGCPRFRVGQGGGSGIPVYPKKIRQPKNTQNSSKYTQNYTQVYFIPEIQRKWYTEYPYLSCNIPYARFKKPLYTVYPKTQADSEDWTEAKNRSHLMIKS